MPEPLFRRAGTLLLAALAGASVWVSLGTLAVTDAAAMERAVALPPVWWLGACVIGAVLAASATRLTLSRAWPLGIVILCWLPYLPGKVPAAFLIWQGPIEIAVWCAVVAGLAGPAAWSAFPSVFAKAAEPRCAPWLAAAFVAVCATAGFLSVKDLIPGGDEPHYLIITQSLLRDGDLKIENNHTQRDYAPFFKTDLKPDYLRRGTDGEIYPVHPPGISVLMLPAFAVAGYYGGVATVIAGTSLAAALTWHTAFLLAGSAAGAWFGWAAVFLTVPYFFHTFTIYPDGIGGLLVAVGIWLLVRLETRRPVSTAGLALASAALGALPWFHTRFAVIAGCLGLVVIARLLAGPQRVTRLAAFLAIPAVSAAAWFGYFWYFWGTPNPAAPYAEYTNSAVAFMGRGMAGLLIDHQFGLFANAPVYAVAVMGLATLWRTHRRLLFELLLVTVPYVAATASYGMWWGGWSAPARFIAALMPIAALPMACWWRAQSGTAWRAMALALLLLSALCIGPRLLVNEGALMYNTRDGFDLLLDWAARGVDLPKGFPAVHRGATETALAEAAIWVGAGLAWFLVAWAMAGRAVRAGVGAVWAVSVLAAAVCSMAAVSVVWAYEGDAGVTTSRSQVNILSEWRPDWLTTTLHLRPFRRLSSAEFVRQIELGSTDRVPPGKDTPLMLSVSWLPAAEYDLVTGGVGAPLSGELFALVGKTEEPIERWRLEGRRGGFSGFTLRLPVPVRTLNLRGDGEAKTSAEDVRLRVKALRPAVSAPGQWALRAARYGAARAFFLDEHVWVEPGGFWTRAEADSTIVLDVDQPGQPVTIWMQTGPVPTTMTLSAGTWSTRVDIDAQARRSVTLPQLPAGQDAWSVTFRSGAGFRPSEYDPKNQDARNLGVWVQIR